MDERQEGMTDKQRIKAMGVSEKAEKEIDACIERHKSKMA